MLKYWRILKVGPCFYGALSRFGLPRQENLCYKPQSQMESQTISIRLPGSYASDVIIGNPAELERKKRAIKAAGLSTLQVPISHLRLKAVWFALASIHFQLLSMNTGSAVSYCNLYLLSRSVYYLVLNH